MSTPSTPLRLAIIKLSDLHTCFAKITDSAVLLPLHLDEPPSEQQLRLLALASPFAPVMVTARVSTAWNGKAFPAEITSVESPPRIQIPKKRTLRTGVWIRKRGGVMLPE